MSESIEEFSDSERLSDSWLSIDPDSFRLRSRFWYYFWEGVKVVVLLEFFEIIERLRNFVDNGTEFFSFYEALTNNSPIRFFARSNRYFIYFLNEIIILSTIVNHVFYWAWFLDIRMISVDIHQIGASILNVLDKVNINVKVIATLLMLFSSDDKLVYFRTKLFYSFFQSINQIIMLNGRSSRDVQLTFPLGIS